MRQYLDFEDLDFCLIVYNHEDEISLFLKHTEKVNILKILLHESLSLDLISYLDINWKYTVIEIKHVALTTGHFFFLIIIFGVFWRVFFYM